MSFTAPVGSAQLDPVPLFRHQGSLHAPSSRIDLEGLDTTSSVPAVRVALKRFAEPAQSPGRVRLAAPASGSAAVPSHSSGETGRGLHRRQVGVPTIGIDPSRLRPVLSPRSSTQSLHDGLGGKPQMRTKSSDALLSSQHAETTSTLCTSTKCSGIPQSARRTAPVRNTATVMQSARSPDTQMATPNVAAVQVGTVIKEASRILCRASSPTLQQQQQLVRAAPSRLGGSMQVPMGCATSGSTSGSLQLPMASSHSVSEPNCNSKRVVGNLGKRIPVRVVASDGSRVADHPQSPRIVMRIEPSTSRKPMQRSATLDRSYKCVRPPPRNIEDVALNLGTGTSSPSCGVSFAGSTKAYETSRQNRQDWTTASPIKCIVAPTPPSTVRSCSVPVISSPRGLTSQARSNSETLLAIQNHLPARPAKILSSAVLSCEAVSDSASRGVDPHSRTTQVQQVRAALAEKENQLAEAVEQCVSRLTLSRRKTEDTQVHESADITFPIATNGAVSQRGVVIEPFDVGASQQSPHITPRHSELTSPAITPSATPRLAFQDEATPRNPAKILKVPMLNLNFHTGAAASSQGYVSTRSSDPSPTPREQIGSLQSAASLTPRECSPRVMNNIAPLESMRYELIVFDFDLTLSTVMLGVETRAFPKPISEVSVAEFGGEFRVELLKKMFSTLLLSGVQFFIVSLGYHERIRQALGAVGLGTLFPYGSILGRDSEEMQACDCHKSGVIMALMKKFGTSKDMTLYIDDSPGNIDKCREICTVFCPQGLALSVVEIDAIINNFVGKEVSPTSD